MIQVRFQNLESSEFVEMFVRQKWEHLERTYPDLIRHRAQLNMVMDNSPTQPGRDSFVVTLRVVGKRFRNIMLRKEGINLYLALAELFEHSGERFHRALERRRSRNLKTQRRFAKRQRDSGLGRADEAPGDDAVSDSVA